MTAAWLVIVNLFALIAFNRLNLAPDTAFDWMSAGTVRPVHQSWNIIDLHNRWDAYWYLTIAQDGYDLRGEGDISNVVFFPLYPLLVRLLGPLAGDDLVPGPVAPHEDGLEHPLLADRRGKLLELRILEALSRLLGAPLDRLDRQREERASRNGRHGGADRLGRVGQQRRHPTTERGPTLLGHGHGIPPTAARLVTSRASSR